MRRHPLRLLAALIFLLAPAPARAWNKPGHMVTGAIAYYELRETDPSALAQVVSLLKRHPFYESEWLPRINALQDDDPNKHDLYLFMYAARWPDDIRGTDLHCEKCHFINYPYKPPGQPASVVAQGEDPQQNIVRAFGRRMSTVRNNPSAPERAQALCWIFHLVGDVHQPLHTSALFTLTFPNGDRGGTRFFVRADENADTIHLHSFWDGLIMGSQRFRSVNNRARGLRGRDEFARDRLQELSERRFERWAKSESFELAKTRAYLTGGLEGSPDETDGAVLPEGYGGEAQRVAERRAVLAGYRLADILGELF